MTQPLMYAKIKGHPSVRDLYAQRLIAEGVATQGDVDGWIKEFDTFLDEEFDAGKAYHANKADWLDGKWASVKLPTGDERYVTGVPKQKLVDLGRKMTTVPERISIHRTVERVIAGRREFGQTPGPNWLGQGHEPKVTKSARETRAQVLPKGMTGENERMN
jgi:2-oxoglutarate dehydrogenase E1 component